MDHLCEKSITCVKSALLIIYTQVLINFYRIKYNSYYNHIKVLHEKFKKRVIGIVTKEFEKSTERTKRFSISIDSELVSWLEKEIKSKRFRNKSHGLEVALKIIKKKIEAGEKIEYD